MSELSKDDPLFNAVQGAAERLASGLEHRIANLADKETRVRSSASWETLPNLPARLVWEALEPGAAAFFVVYKLVHEARSELPKVYRGIAWALCAAQPDRFGLVTYREQLWDALAALDEWPEGPLFASSGDSRQFVLDKVRERGKTDWWSCRASDQETEAAWISDKLLGRETIREALRNIRRLQVFSSSAFTAGNVIMRIPGELDTLVENICSQASQGHLLPFEDIQDRIAALAGRAAKTRIPEISRNHSVPFDLVAMESDGKLYLIVLARGSMDQTKKEDLRRRLLYLRFFGHYAFGRVNSKELEVVLAFYADKGVKPAEWSISDPRMFHGEEVWGFDQFWNYIADRGKGGELVETLTGAAANKLRSQDLTSKLRVFVSGKKKPTGPLVSDQLVIAYLNTSYIVSGGGREIRLRPGLYCAEFDAVLVGAGVTTWACITAFNPGSRPHSDQENDVLHYMLQGEIRDAGYAALEGHGVADEGAWPAERSLFVLGIGRDEARRLGSRFGQNAILVGQLGHAPELLVL